ncbi:hypothetical protein ACMG4H_14260 [Corynebacterium glutamicum]|uniref:hypothetical protein n=1 Tax=Corynebacterium glutamicum TaxID=1718 RepID=UPI003C7D60AB
MSNQERAAEIILGRTATDAAQALADAGLLMPDLPEPNEEVIWYEDSGVWRDSFEVWASEHHGTIEISGMGQPQIHIPVGRAEHLALCIIAAAKLAEEQE